MDKVIATGFNLPPFFLKDKVVIINYNSESKQMSVASDFSGIRSQYPLTFLSNASVSRDFVFPIDPFINLSFKNIITRRRVAKGSNRGTIKERWTQDDVEITISGILINPTGAYPEEVDRLVEFFEARQAIDVTSPLLNQHSIFSIVIESLDLPHTKGLENQAFTIKAYSDDVFELLQKQ
ncbi:MAG TPA: DUF6046 domain-containing protein, partial [Bacteroidales bacterium]|nr:DUF6046 domain-containing protein [Bacteroidales bacterium]